VTVEVLEVDVIDVVDVDDIVKGEEKGEEVPEEETLSWLSEVTIVG